jgi:hypothetical protein
VRACLSPLPYDYTCALLWAQGGALLPPVRDHPLRTYSICADCAVPER